MTMTRKPDARRVRTQLRTQGFRPLKDGCIHLRCPRCGRKQSNIPRDPEQDHPTAFLVEVPCEKCGMGCKIDGGEFYDKRGRYLSNDPHFWKARHDQR